jgi:hypothetical protein
MSMRVYVIILILFTLYLVLSQINCNGPIASPKLILFIEIKVFELILFILFIGILHLLKFKMPIL